MLGSSDDFIKYFKQLQARLLFVSSKNKIIELKEIRAKLQHKVFINSKLMILKN